VTFNLKPRVSAKQFQLASQNSKRLKQKKGGVAVYNDRLKTEVAQGDLAIFKEAGLLPMYSATLN
jgi:hypothetical protein